MNWDLHISGTALRPKVIVGFLLFHPLRIWGLDSRGYIGGQDRLSRLIKRLAFCRGDASTTPGWNRHAASKY
jgi:hypothetical protein